MKQTDNMGLWLLESGDPLGVVPLNENFARLDEGMSALLPRGMITAWYGACDSIPSGWALCDGQNGTPDLRGRFVLGAAESADANPDPDNLLYSLPGSSGGSRQHTLTVEEMPRHSHSISTTGNSGDVGTYVTRGPITKSAGISTGNSGDGRAHNNMPPYYTLAYIMKL